MPYWGTLPLRGAALGAAPARERSMRSFVILLAVPGVGALLFLAASSPGLAQQKPAERPAAQQPAPGGAGRAPVDKFSVVSQNWHRFPGLAVADITFQNANDFRVRDAVVSCEFLDPKGKLVATRGSTVFQSFPPGRKKIDGIEFSLREKNAVPGSCRVLSVSTVGGPN
jgi:hypothetical protein